MSILRSPQRAGAGAGAGADAGADAGAGAGAVARDGFLTSENDFGRHELSWDTGTLDVLVYSS